MTYGSQLVRKIREWVDDGTIPLLTNLGVAELGAQMIAPSVQPEEIAALVAHFGGDFDEARLADQFPAAPNYYAYVAEVWRLCGVRYFSYDVLEAPGCRLFDLNFHDVPAADRGCAGLVTNVGTTEHVANQFNAFRVIHDLLTVGGVALHQVPFTGHLNHCLVNYHPKFFISLILNNRYRLRYLNFNGPVFHRNFGGSKHIFDGDCLPEPGAWASTPLPSGTVDLLIEKRFDEPFIPPIDFAVGYFDPTPPPTNLRDLVNVDVTENLWANAYRRGVTPSQTASSNHV
jgi:hypothetical protein